MSNIIRKYFKDFETLLFPNLCPCCQEPMVFQEEMICTHCLQDLPYTDFLGFADNKVAKSFWGRFPFERAAAVFYFEKGDKIQHLIHQLKYKKQAEIGVFLGKIMAEQMLKNNFQQSITALAAVPMYLKKQVQRGYNQCDFILQGIVSVLPLKNLSPYLLKIKDTDSQTKKHRYERYDNLQAVFKVTDYTVFEQEHVLLIDDVITTGATLESVCNLLYSGCNNLKISILSTAVAGH